MTFFIDPIRSDDIDTADIGAYKAHLGDCVVHIWHDHNNMITGCYEAEAVFYETVAEALAHPQIMDYAR